MYPGTDAVSGATILGCAGHALSDDEGAFFRDADPWGFILFSRNVETPAQVRRLTGALRDAVGRDAPIFVDQEGGRVARLTPPHWRGWPPARDQVLGMPPEDARRAMYLRARLIADELRAVGIDGNCAPLADIARAETHAILLNRCYGDAAERVVEVARAVAEGCLNGGVLPVLKHIPGHGRATRDSHLDLPRVTASRAELDATDFAAFAGLSDLPLAMTSHVIFEALDPDHCATQSPAAVAMIRDALGFDGLLMTDDVSMHALRGPMVARCASALAAGCDVILHCNGDRAEMEAVVAAAERLFGQSAARAARALSARRAPGPFDVAAADAEYRRLAGAHV